MRILTTRARFELIVEVRRAITTANKDLMMASWRSPIGHLASRAALSHAGQENEIENIVLATGTLSMMFLEVDQFAPSQRAVD